MDLIYVDDDQFIDAIITLCGKNRQNGPDKLLDSNIILMVLPESIELWDSGHTTFSYEAPIVLGLDRVRKDYGTIELSIIREDWRTRISGSDGQGYQGSYRPVRRDKVVPRSQRRYQDNISGAEDLPEWYARRA